MTFFLKLNAVSIMYAFMIFLPLELMANIYRIGRLSGKDIGTLSVMISVFIILIFMLETILLLLLTKKWLEGRKSTFWTMILWIPYFILFVYIFASLFPITNRGDHPNPVTGLLAIAGFIVFPFYIFFINTLALHTKNETIQE